MPKSLPDEVKIAKESTISLGGTAIGSVLRYLFNILIARILGVELLGMYALSLSLSRLVGVVGKLGLEKGVVRYVSHSHALGRVPDAVATIRRGTLVGLIGSVVVAIFLFITAPVISDRIFHAGNSVLPQLLRWFALSIPFMVIAQILAGGSQGFKVLKHPALALQVYPNLFLVVAFLGLVFWTGPLWTLSVAVIGSQILSFGAAAFFLNRLVKMNRPVDASPPDDLVRFSLPLMFISIMSMIIHWSDIIMLGALQDAHAAGLYQPAARTATTLNLFLISFKNIFGPIVSGHYAREDTSRIRDLLQLVCRWSLMISWPAFLFFMLYAGKIMLIFGTDFLEARDSLRILGAGQVLVALGTGNGTVITMTGYPRLNLINNLIALIVNIVANLLLIPRYGILGAAVSTALALTLLSILRFIEVWILHRIQPMSWKQLKPLAAGGIAWIVCYGMNAIIFHWHTIAVLLVGGIVFVGVYVALLLLLRLDEDDREVLRAFRRKLGRGIL